GFLHRSRLQMLQHRTRCALHGIGRVATIFRTLGRSDRSVRRTELLRRGRIGHPRLRLQWSDLGHLDRRHRVHEVAIHTVAPRRQSYNAAMPIEQTHLETQLVHAGVRKQAFHGAAVTPIVRSTVFETQKVVDYHDVVYPRLSNLPNQNEAARAIASIEGGEAGLVTASVMAAITAVLLSVLQGGGHLLAQRPLYGASQLFAQSPLRQLGARGIYIAVRNPDSWSGAVKADTR